MFHSEWVPIWYYLLAIIISLTVKMSERNENGGVENHVKKISMLLLPMWTPVLSCFLHYWSLLFSPSNIYLAGNKVYLSSTRLVKCR